MINLTIPLPPPLSAAYKNVARSGRAKTSKAKQWHEEASLAIKRQYISLVPITAPYEITYVIFFKDKRRSDICNREKMASDLLTDMSVIWDDSYIDKMTLIRGGIDKNNPRVEISISTTY